MSTIPSAAGAVPPTVRLVAEIDPTDPVAEVDAAVIRHQLERRLGPLTLLLCTTSEVTATARSSWRSGFPGSSVDVDVTGTALFEGPVHLAALFHEQADALAIDVRRRMRAHLDRSVDGLPGTALDVYTHVLDHPGSAGDHAGLVALRDGPSTSATDLHAAFDRLADEITHAAPGVATVQSQQLIVDDLRRALADERHETARLGAAVQRLDDTIVVLTKRLADAAQAETLDGDTQDTQNGQR